MKRFHFAAICALLMAFTALAQGNRVIIEDFEIAPDSTLTIPVMLANTDSTRGLQFNLTLPEGLQVKSMTTSSYSKSLGMTISRNFQNGYYVVMLYQSARVCYPPDSACIANIRLKADPDFTGGEMTIWKVIGSTIDNFAFPIDGDTALVTVPTSSLLNIPYDQPPVREQYFNLMGNPIQSPDTVPVAIEVITRPDGSCTSRKVAVR